jgi:ammonia channel protein AmtB
MAKFLGGLLIAIGLGMLAMGAVNYLGYGLGLDGNTPIVAVGLMFLFLGWLKFGEKPKTESESTPSISDNDRQR